MFLYQTRKIKADVRRGILKSQYQMVDLYNTNLNAVGTQAGFIASLSYTVIMLNLTMGEIRTGTLATIYCSFYAISISSALIIMSHCILASMLGPTKALVGFISNSHWYPPLK